MIQWDELGCLAVTFLNFHILWFINLYCCYSIDKSCPTLCDHMYCSTPGFPVLYCLPEFAQTHVHWVNDVIKIGKDQLLPGSALWDLVPFFLATNPTVSFRFLRRGPCFSLEWSCQTYSQESQAHMSASFSGEVSIDLHIVLCKSVITF